MRRSGFGEAYCHTASEAQRLIDESGAEPYLPSFPPDPPEGDFGATIEIAASGNGENICFIEAPTAEAVNAILAELGLAPSAL